LLLVLCLRLGQNMLEPFIVLFVRQLGPQQWVAAMSSNPAEALERTTALAFTVLALAQVLFTPLWGRMADRYGPLRCLAVLGLCLGTVLGVTAASGSIDQFLLLRALAACFMAGSMTLAYAAASKRVVAARRTLAFSMVQSCMQFGFGLSAPLGAAIAAFGASETQVNLRLCFVIAGLICIVAGVGMLLLRRLPSGRDEHAPPLLGAERT
jgi:MFS family permease